jgi:hypothetical protein
LPVKLPFPPKCCQFVPSNAAPECHSEPVVGFDDIID